MMDTNAMGTINFILRDATNLGQPHSVIREMLRTWARRVASYAFFEEYVNQTNGTDGMKLMTSVQ